MSYRSIWLILLIGSMIFSVIQPINYRLIRENPACEYWVAPFPEGNDVNSGSIGKPWASMEHAARNIPDNGCTVWFRPGIYYGDQRISRRFEVPVTFKAIQNYRSIIQHDGMVVSISGGRNVTIEGFRFRHTGPVAEPLVFAVDRSGEGWAEQIILRNNIFQDSYNNDLLKIYNGARFVTVENNLFLNQGSGEEHMDVNSVTDVVIQNNIFFNDFSGSGRDVTNETKQYIVIKDSNEGEDGLEGSERVYVRKNIFLNWQGRPQETFIQVGLDGKPFHEAKDIHIENNLIIGNSPNRIGAPFGVRGARDVYFVNNTVVGDLPAGAYAFRITISDRNPINENIYFYNNIWSDPTGTMGTSGPSGGEFSDGDPDEVSNLVLNRNLYWNGGHPIPPGDVASPMVDDRSRVLADPGITTNQNTLVLPRWTGTAFLSGSRSIREEFTRLVERYGKITESSPAMGKSVLEFAPAEDILGRKRSPEPDNGAYESDPVMVEERDQFLPLVVLEWIILKLFR